MSATATYAARCNRYARAVVAGRIVASRLTVAACKRHLDDLERRDFPFEFSVDEANRICGFVETFPHVKGQWARARQWIRLEDWQCFVLCVSHGWLERETRNRRFRSVYIEVPRKNAKTTLSAPVALDKLTADGEQGAEVVVAATKKEQANIAFGIAQSMTKKSEAFRTEFGVMVRAHSILCLETDSTFKALDSRGQTQDGANLHFSLNDELHAWKGRELYSVLETAMGSRAQPMMWNITTAGADQSGICYELRQYLEKILLGVHRDERFFGVIYTVDEGDDIYSERTWKKANPNYGVSVLPHDMKTLANKARNNPKSRADFKMKRLNVWINAAAQYFDVDAWKDCADPNLKLADFVGEPCRIGLDLASKRDINAKIKIFRRGIDYYLFPKFWLPRQAVLDGANASYRGWEEEGWLNVTEGNVVDYEAIRESVEEDADSFDVEEVGFDPHQAYHLIRLLMDAGIRCAEIRPTVLNFSEPMKELDKLIAERRIHHDGNPVMAWMLSNVTAVLDRKDNVYPRKEREENKIDGPIAAIMALASWLANEPEPALDVYAMVG
jgi:phage terminase large subunit-like protein